MTIIGVVKAAERELRCCPWSNLGLRRDAWNDDVVLEFNNDMKFCPEDIVATDWNLRWHWGGTWRAERPDYDKEEA